MIPSMWVSDLIINCSVLISWKDAVFNWGYGPLLISAKKFVYSDIWHMEQKTGILREGEVWSICLRICQPLNSPCLLSMMSYSWGLV